MGTQSKEHAQESLRFETIDQITGGLAHEYNNLLGIEKPYRKADLVAAVATTACEAMAPASSHGLAHASRNP